MRILITGVAGFIGFHLASELLKKKYHIIGIDNLNDYYSPKFKNQKLNLIKKKKNFKFLKIDLKKKKDLNFIFKKYKPKVIYHLASQPGIMYSFKNPKTYITNNIVVTKNLIEQSLKNKVEKFYFTSSSSVYGNKKIIYTPKLVLKPYRKGEMKKTYGSNKLLKKTINFNNFTSIENGIEKTLDWYKKFKNKNLLYFNKVKYE